MPEVTTLRDETRRLLKDRPASLPMTEIAEELDVSLSWLHSFQNGTIKNPGVVTIETLNTLLKKRMKVCR